MRRGGGHRLLSERRRETISVPGSHVQPEPTIGKQCSRGIPEPKGGDCSQGVESGNGHLQGTCPTDLTWTEGPGSEVGL